MWQTLRNAGSSGLLHLCMQLLAVTSPHPEPCLTPPPAFPMPCSNPMAGTDNTLLALAGAGFPRRRSFGFASCERAVGAAEGMNVLAQVGSKLLVGVVCGCCMS